ncbi:MAG: hypothetical protein EOO25_06585, partial [Comamonadaceae bacterium]
MIGFLVALALASPQQRADLSKLRTEPGLTVWVWDVDGRIDRHPKVAEGQVPNAYLIASTLDVKDGFESQEGPLRDSFIGRAFGWLNIPVAGTYRFRLTCDDGATLTLGGRPLLDTELGSDFTDERSVTLEAGDYPVEIPFYEDGGNFRLRLEWQRPGETGYSTVPN